LHSNNKNYAEAEKYLLLALEKAKEIGALNNERVFEETLSELYSNTNRHRQALVHYKRAVRTKDSLFSAENRKQLVIKEMTFDFEKKEAVANADHKKELENQQVLAEEKSRKQKLVIIFVIGGLLLVIVFSGFVFRSLRLTRKQKQIIEIKSLETAHQKLVIEEKNKDITDSITYAKRIQQAKLPKKEEIYSALPKSFVLFKPKDIVSGDFYFFHKTDHCVFIAAADCTGHGVPGAFMSIIGSEKLEEAVSQSMNTSVILNQLNKGIKASLRQSDSDESTRDGMDIAICSVDTRTRIVNYSGANRAIWIIRSGQAEVEEIKATKTAIGGLTSNDQRFETHEIKLQKDDTFYISTDGYADQFSGHDGKKLMTRKFKEILIGIQNKTMPEQEDYLDNFIENWKGGTEQVDDILVIGVRL
jgi:serine phosphatase RsbU (regulator of sigma subunit)